MPELTNEQRQELWAEFMCEISAAGEPIAITKAELRAAVDALDTYFDDNAAAINNTLPAAAKAGLTTTQKARLLMFVVRARYLYGA